MTNYQQQTNNIGVDLMDILEATLISYLQVFFKSASKEITKQEARNLLTKIGARMVYGKEVADKVLFDVNPQTPKENL